MPVISSPYKARALFKNGHFSTIYSAKLRPIPKVAQERERLFLEDGDFIDIDWSFSTKKSHKVAVLLHGLEGDAQRVYMKGQAKTLVENGWDVSAMNHRGCSGEENKLYRSYNSGRTEDVAALINHIMEQDRYVEIALVGFSLGGNLVLKYLGERNDVPRQITKAVSVSAPLDLRGSLEQLIKFENFVYNFTFVKDLKGKYKRKMKHFPEIMSPEEYKKVKTLLDFDNLYTAPAHGFKDAYDYYKKSSSLQFLHNIKIPALILNARNDSFLSEKCYPFELAEKHQNIYLESPRHGGHVGFHVTNKRYYSEKRALDFLNK
jgi:uncharacterized protein